MTGIPLHFCARSNPITVDSEVGFSWRAVGGDVIKRGCSRRNLEIGFGWRRKSSGIPPRDVIQSTFLFCQHRWRRGSSSMWENLRSLDLRAVTEQLRRGQIRAVLDQGMEKTRNRALGSNLRSLDLRVVTEQLRRGRIRATLDQGLERTRNRALGSKVGETQILSFSTREYLVGTLGRQSVGSRKCVQSSRLHATLDPYKTLGIPDTATDKEIKQAYRRLALKYHPDVSKEPGAQQKFMQIKNAYQTLVDNDSRAKYEARKRNSSSWDPFGWESKKSSTQKPEDEFYGFGEFFKDISISIEEFLRDLQADSHQQASKPKSLWEELADIGEEFVEFLEKELNISDMNEETSSGTQDDQRMSNFRSNKKGSEGDTHSGPGDPVADKAKVESDIAEIEDMLANLKKELGI